LKKILVTKPSLPPLSEFMPYLDDIWESKSLTNGSKYHHDLETALAEYLNVKYISLVTNGTLGLVIALQALRITGEVITTPYSFVATTHALWWNGIKPVFVDIDPEYGNLNPEKIEAAITPQTTAILPVHVYGNPCNVEQIQKIADQYGLKILYDSCHTFGAEHKDTPILNYGDLSVMSFHATKVFNTFEGGAIVSNDADMKARIDNLKNFGFTGETTIASPGINAKMNEFQAALGLLQLKYIGKYIEKRKKVSEWYRSALRGIPGVSCLKENKHGKKSYSYFPIMIDSEVYGKTRDELYEELKIHEIYGRRYFYPLISQFPVYSGLDSSRKGAMPVAEKMASEVLCLPLYSDIQSSTVNRISTIIKDTRR
jgi:dTDP-4-amino-4,6-dideoxygalactose transaminase